MKVVSILWSNSVQEKRKFLTISPNDELDSLPLKVWMEDFALCVYLQNVDVEKLLSN